MTIPVGNQAEYWPAQNSTRFPYHKQTPALVWCWRAYDGGRVKTLPGAIVVIRSRKDSEHVRS